MDSLYGDLPPPKSTEQRENNDKNENNKNVENSTSFSCTFRYVDINKNLITPATVQKKFGKKINKKKNEDTVSEECDNPLENNDQNIDNEPKKDERKIECVNKNDNKDENKNEINEHKENSMNNLEQKKSEEKEANFINGIDKNLLGMSDFVQNDLKKISEKLNKIQKFTVPSWALTENVVEYVNTYDKKNHIEKKGLDKKKVDGKNENEQEKEKQVEKKYHAIEENEQIDNDLYEKYCIENADEEYDPLNPNDLNKIIKERKRKLFNKMNEEIERKKFRVHIEVEQTSERETDADLVDPYAGYMDYLENNYPRKQNNEMHKNIEEQIGREELKEKEFSEINATTNKYYGENDWDAAIEMETENEKDRIEESDEHIYKEKNEERSKEGIEERTENENEHYLPQMGESYLQKNDVTDVEIPESTLKKDFATRMMEKMGWKKGEGLGKTRQGITTPLILQRVNKRGGVIVQTTNNMKEDEAVAAAAYTGENERENKNNINYESSSNIEMLKESGLEKVSLNCENIHSNNIKSRYVLLKNVFTTTEIDTILKEEIEDEASHFGNLLNIHFFSDQSTSKNVSWINILCEYESTEQANSAVKGFSKKILKGRYVNASFINEADSLAYINNAPIHNGSVERK